MRFGRVVGTVAETAEPGVEKVDHGRLHLTVTLEDRETVSVVRSESVPILHGALGPMDLAWQADQYTQETIGNELALAGWEPIGTGDDLDGFTGAALTASSPTYVVRIR